MVVAAVEVVGVPDPVVPEVEATADVEAVAEGLVCPAVALVVVVPVVVVVVPVVIGAGLNQSRSILVSACQAGQLHTSGRSAARLKNR